jgi:hypothetical protein
MRDDISELVDRAKRREPGGREALVAELRPWFLGVMLKDFSHLTQGHAEMLEACEATLLRWIREKPDLVRREQPPGVLAWRLLSQTGKQWARDREHEREAIEGLTVERETGWVRNKTQKMSGGVPSIETGFEATGVDAERAIAALGEPHRSTLLAEIAHKLGGGPSLEERFALAPTAARKRLSRAREALVQLLRGKEGAES